MTNISVFTVFHRCLYEELYEQLSDSEPSLVFFAVNEEIEKDIPAKFQERVIEECKLPVYDPRYQALMYNEASALFHVFMNHTYSASLDYIGFAQYDMKFPKDFFTNIRDTVANTDHPCIFTILLMDAHSCTMLQNQAWDNGTTLDSYNKHFGTSFTMNDVYKNCIPMNNTFVVPKWMYEKMMGWMKDFFDQPERIKTFVSKHYGNPGHFFESMTALFLNLEVLQGARFYDSKLQHIWPLYKHKTNESI